MKTTPMMRYPWRRGATALPVLVFAYTTIPTEALAYLDPGTGNILIYATLSILGTVFYLCKNIAFALMRRLGLAQQTTVLATGHEDLVLFSEGKSYWLTFKPVIEALIAAKRPFRYISMDSEDPALTIESEYMLSRYIGTGSAAFARACNVRAKVMLATTPNIGTPGFPMPVPPYVGCLAHVLHGVGDVGYYMRGSLDHHHAVLLMGPYMEKTIRHLEHLRGTPAKECASVGIPYLDVLVQNKKESAPTGKPVILVAPSWGAKGSLGRCEGMIRSLLHAGYEVIFRPHPHSRRVEADLLDAVHTALQGQPGYSLDTHVDGGVSMSRASLLISDKSGVRFDFAFLYEKPVITLDAPIENPEQYELTDLEYVWEEEAAKQLGLVISADDVPNIAAHVAATLAKPLSNITALRDTDLACLGTSGQATAAWLIAKCQAGGVQ